MLSRRARVLFLLTSLVLASRCAPLSDTESVSNISININAGSGQYGQRECKLDDLAAKIQELRNVLADLSADFKSESNRVANELQKLNEVVVQNLYQSEEQTPIKAKPQVLARNSNATGQYFHFGQISATWYEADNLCKQDSLQLVNIQNTSKLRGLWEFASTRTWSKIWTSGTDQGQEPGDFHWLSGKPVPIEFFKHEQPDDFGLGMDTCLVIFEGRLHDAPCNEKNFYVCEEAKKQ